MVNIEYFKNRVIAAKKAAEASAAGDPLSNEQDLIREFVATYLQPAPAAVNEVRQ